VEGRGCRWFVAEVEEGRVMDGGLYGLESCGEYERSGQEMERERWEG
jgi:hypothetical protein